MSRIKISVCISRLGGLPAAVWLSLGMPGYSREIRTGPRVEWAQWSFSWSTKSMGTGLRHFGSNTIQLAQVFVTPSMFRLSE